MEGLKHSLNWKLCCVTLVKELLVLDTQGEKFCLEDSPSLNFMAVVLIASKIGEVCCLEKCSKVS